MVQPIPRDLGLRPPYQQQAGFLTERSPPGAAVPEQCSSGRCTQHPDADSLITVTRSCGICTRFPFTLPTAQSGRRHLLFSVQFVRNYNIELRRMQSGAAGSAAYPANIFCGKKDGYPPFSHKAIHIAAPRLRRAQKTFEEKSKKQLTKSISHAKISKSSGERTHKNEYGRVPEWPMGTDCKSAAFSFGGSNPPAPTKQEKSEPISDWRRVRIFRFLRV